MADKARKLYITKPETYRKLIHESTTKLYKKAEPETVNKINRKAMEIAVDLKLADTIEALPNKEDFVNLKVHQQNFKNNPQ